MATITYSDKVTGDEVTAAEMNQIKSVVNENSTNAGPTGPTGPTGPKGDKGDTGDTGPTGATGATGAKGDKGDPGDGGSGGITSLTGDVTGSGTGAVTTAIGVGKVTNTMLAGSIPDAKISSAGTWNAKQSALTAGTDYTTPAGVETLTNKRITKRVGTTASGSTITPVGDSNDIYTVTALAANATIAAPSGTLTDGQSLIIRIKDNGTARTLTWNAIYREGSDLTKPLATLPNKTMYLHFIYNAADSKLDFIGMTGGF